MWHHGRVPPGLLATALTQELAGEVRRHGVVVWLDGPGAFMPFVDELAVRSRAGEVPFPVLAFRGSFLELMLALEGQSAGLDPSPLLLHMPGFTEETIRRTPLLELYELGVRFRKAPETLVREVASGRVAPDAIDRWLAQGPVDLAATEAWLAGQLTSTREGLASLLEELGAAPVLDAAVELLQGRPSFLRERVRSEAELEVLAAYLGRQTGMDASWLDFYGADPGETPLASLAAALVGWLLAVEFVHDLARPPAVAGLAQLARLTAPLVKACQALVEHLRARSEVDYAALADDVEGHLQAELSSLGRDDLGRVDTFRSEEIRALDFAVEELRAGAWARAEAWARTRAEASSFWLRRDEAEPRRRAWALVKESAALGVLLVARPTPLAATGSLAEATQAYAEHGAEVDRAHRRFEQRQSALLDGQVPRFGNLREVVRALRQAYRSWADGVARAFDRACRESGFLPDASLQQRTLYDQVIHPLAQGDRVALFLLDAFRFELATELLDTLRSPGMVVDLKPRLAELPTITAVGMNAIPPVAQGGRLTVAGQLEGFRSGEFTVRTPDNRARAIALRSSGKGSLLLSLASVCEDEPETLKRRIAGARVVVVHGTELDGAGEANVGAATFEHFLRQVRIAFGQLQRAGVKSFVFTADHGFLLADETTRRVRFGSRRDPCRRYVLDDHPRVEEGLTPVSLAALGYDGLAGHLLLRDDTAIFDTGGPSPTFVHGGNSPQERVIPVLTVRRERAPGRTIMAYRVEAEALRNLLGVHRIRLRLRPAHDGAGQLGFVGAPAVTLALRAPGHPEIRAVLKDATGPCALDDGALRLQLDDAWSELFFELTGPSSTKAQVEVFHPDAAEQVEPCRLEERFEVAWRRGGAAQTEPAGAPERALGWADAILDEGARRVFLHLEAHGSVSEAEATGMVGSPRAFRRFSLQFDALASRAPFKVRIEVAPDGKRYVKEGER